MAACRFDSPSLITSISGTTATPTFAFDPANSAYFGLSGQFTSNNGGGICSFPTRSVGPEGTWTYAITPVVATSNGSFGRATTCSVLQPKSFDATGTGLTTYTGIDCPSATNNAFLPGTYTLKFFQDGGIDIASQVFLVASPTAIVNTTTSTYYQTVTFPVQTTATATATKYTSTETWTATRPLSTTTTTIPITVTRIIPSCSSTTSESSVQPTPTGGISPDGTCGGRNRYICGPGECCSVYGYCGATEAYCGTGCQPQFGTCELPDPSQSSPQPSATLKVSLDGACGRRSGQTCRGSSFGNCCSQYNYCGRSAAYCAEGCQPQYGTCDASPKRRLAMYEARDKDAARRAISGKGPDYTYPPIPRSTVTTTATNLVIIFPSPVGGTTTVGGIATTTVGGVVTLTKSNPVATRTAILLCGAKELQN